MISEEEFVPYQCHSTLPGRDVLVLAPHPDDEVFGCGATLCRMAEQGARVRVWLLTEGVVREQWQAHLAGEAHREALAEIRRAESCAAAELLGYPAPTSLTYEDAKLGEQQELGRQLFDLLGDDWPDLLLAPSQWEMHRDHRAAARAALQLVSLINNKQSEPVCQLAMYEVGVPLVPNFLIDITPVLERKAQAMQCFASQLAVQRYDRQLAGLNCFRSYTLGLGVEAAEAFHLLNQAEVDRILAEPSPVASGEAHRALLAGEQRVEALRGNRAGRPLSFWQRGWRKLKQLV